MTTTTTTTDTELVVRNWTDALNNHDVAAAMPFFTEQSVLTNHSAGHQMKGLDAIRGDLEGLLARFSDMHIETTRLFVDGSHYAKVWAMTGLQTGDLPGLPATGRPFRIHGVGYGEVREGRFIEVHELWNPIELMNQVKAPQ